MAEEEKEFESVEKVRPEDVAETAVKKARGGRLNKKAVLYCLFGFIFVVMVGTLFRPEPKKKGATETAEVGNNRPDFEKQFAAYQDKAGQGSDAMPATTPQTPRAWKSAPTGDEARSAQTPPPPPQSFSKTPKDGTTATRTAPVAVAAPPQVAPVPYVNPELMASDDSARKSGMTISLPSDGSTGLAAGKGSSSMPYYADSTDAMTVSTGGGNGGSTSSLAAQYRDWNDQQGKAAFAAKAQPAAIVAKPPIEPEQCVTAGTIIPALLYTAINTDIPGDIVAIVSQTVYDSASGKNILIPQGSKLIAKYNSGVTWGQSRVQIVWSKLIRPDGVEVDLGAMNAVDAQGMAGVKGSVNEHPFRVAGGIGLMVALSLVAGQAQFSATQLIPQGADVVEQATESINQVGMGYVDRSLSVQPTITVAQGTKIQVFINGTIWLPPVKPQGVPQKYSLTSGATTTGGGK